MKTLAEIINPSFAECLKDGIHDAPKGTKWIAVHVSSWHMSVFYECYSDLQKVVEDIAQPLIDPMCYSHIKLVWELETEQLVYFNSMDFVSDAHRFWKENKDKPEAKHAVCVGNVKDLFPEDPYKNKVHYCQADPGETKCYFCGEEVPTPTKEIENDTPEEEEEDNSAEELGLETCPQCNENAWDGYICHSCGLKEI